MKKKFMRLMSFVLVLSIFLSYNVTYAQSLTKDYNEGTRFYQTSSGEKITEEDLIEYIQNNVDKIYKVSDKSIDYPNNLDNNYTVSAAIAIPAWAIGQWVIPLIGTVIVTPTVIKLGNQIVEAGSKLFDTIIDAIDNIIFAKNNPTGRTVGDVQKRLKKEGFVKDRQSGSHETWKKGNRTVQVPNHGSKKQELKPKTLKSIWEQAGWI